MMRAAGGMPVPVPSDLPIPDPNGAVPGAFGISGDNADNDEAVALAGIAAAGVEGDPG